MANEENQAVCSFCGLPGSEDRRLIQGDNCYICDACIGICYQMLYSSKEVEQESQNDEIAPQKEFTLDLTPQEIYDKLSENVVGQAYAKY